jgi:hypothetical protein
MSDTVLSIFVLVCRIHPNIPDLFSSGGQRTRLNRVYKQRAAQLLLLPDIRRNYTHARDWWLTGKLFYKAVLNRFT